MHQKALKEKGIDSMLAEVRNSSKDDEVEYVRRGSKS